MELAYYSDSNAHNTPHLNERCIELALGRYFLDRFTTVAEIGAVTPYYWEPAHSVIDPYDSKATLKADAMSVDVSGNNVLSISVIEHMGTGDYGLKKDKKLPFKFLDYVKALGTYYLITFPVGYNRNFDSRIKAHDLVFFKRVKDLHWVQSEPDFSLRYGTSNPWASALGVITNVPELQKVEFVYGQGT